MNTPTSRFRQLKEAATKFRQGLVEDAEISEMTRLNLKNRSKLLDQCAALHNLFPEPSKNESWKTYVLVQKSLKLSQDLLERVEVDPYYQAKSINYPRKYLELDRTELRNLKAQLDQQIKKAPANVASLRSAYALVSKTLEMTDKLKVNATAENTEQMDLLLKIRAHLNHIDKHIDEGEKYHDKKRALEATIDFIEGRIEKDALEEILDKNSDYGAAVWSSKTSKLINEAKNFMELSHPANRFVAVGKEF